MRSRPQQRSTFPRTTSEVSSRRYDALLHDAVDVAKQLARTRRRHERTILLERFDKLFAERITLLREAGPFVTLEQEMPLLRTIAQRARVEQTRQMHESIRSAFRFVNDHESSIAPGGAASRRTFDTPLTRSELEQYKRARRAVLSRIGCTYSPHNIEAAYSNILTLHKDGFVVHLTHDAVPVAGLPKAERISGATILPYKDGHAGQQVGSYHRGQWLQMIADPDAQRVLDAIAAVVG